MRRLLLVVAACGSRSDPAPHVSPSPPPVKLAPIDAAAACSPLSVTLDGAPIAITSVTCGRGSRERVLVGDGELRVDVDDGGVTWDGTTVREPAPRAEAGDLCLAPATLVGTDRFAGKTLAISGLVHCAEAP